MIAGRAAAAPVEGHDEAPRARVALLGGFSASVDEEPVPDTAWRLKKARELIKLLALAPDHRLHREQVMDILWGDRDPAAAANNLHQAVYVSRRALGADAIVLRDELLRLRAEIDVDRFVLAAAGARGAGSRAAYEAALTIYRGELLPENRYDDWAAERRDELAELAEVLSDELGALGPPAAGRAPSLPAATSSFVGRDRELGELRALLRGTRLLTLAGTGGVGKTRLALELARSVKPSPAHGSALVELAAVADPALLPEAIAAALDVHALSGQTPIEAVVEYLQHSPALVVFDNCEHLLGAVARLAERLLSSAPGLTIVATSREPLRLSGESVFRVPSLAIPDPNRSEGPDELLGYEAVRLLVQRAVAAAPGFALDAENATDVARICFRLDGLPLALELAAGRLAVLGAAAVADRLDNRFSVLRGGGRAAPTRQQTLSAALQWSHDLLATDERVLLRRLGVFAGDFALEAVESVCRGGDELDPAEIADALARLVEKSLVIAEAGSSRERRYRLLETVRMHARERLDEAGEGAALIERHARWALALAESERGSSSLDRDLPNLRAGLEALAELEPGEALRFCVALWPLWMRRIDLHEAQRWLAQALAAAPDDSPARATALLAAAAVEYRMGELARALAYATQSNEVSVEVGDRDAEWHALQFLGECWIARDAAGRAMPWLERALDLARDRGFTPHEAIGVYSIGVAHFIRGELSRAEELVRQSIGLLRPHAGSAQRLMSPVNIAEIRTSRRTGVPGPRIEFQDTLQPFVEISCDEAISYMLANQAGIARARGENVRARTLLDESRARFEEAHDERGIAAVLVRRAYLDLAEDALVPARDALLQALELRRAHGDRRGLGLVLIGLSVVAIAAGQLGAADCRLTEAREIFRGAGDRWAFGSSLWATADLAFARGEYDDAETALLRARAVLEATQRVPWIAHTVAALAQVAKCSGATAKATVLRMAAKDMLSPGKEAGRTTLRTS
jgi:predicted ATPase